MATRASLSSPDFEWMSYSASMSQHSPDPRGAHDFSSPQIRVRGANDFRQYSNQRLRLPNERPPLGPRLRRLFGAILTLAVLGGIGVAVYFGVTELLDEDETSTTQVAETAQQAQTESTEEAAAQSDSSDQTDAAAATAQSEAQDADASAEPQDSTAQSAQAGQTQTAQAEAQPAEPEAQAVAVSSIEPSVAEEQVTPAQINGAEIVADRATAEPIPSGIPRTLADGESYDPTEPTTVFTSRWPVGTTLRLTRLPGATLLTDEEQAEVVGSEALVVVRATESSNTDLQLSPAAFSLIAFYGTERIIAVRVEVTAPPP